LLYQTLKWSVMADTWYVSNAAIDSKDHRGWLIGHFLDNADGVRASDAIKIKWGIHPADDERDSWHAEEDSVVITIRWPSLAH
jgi:hypothetical protein